MEPDLSLVSARKWGISGFQDSHKRYSVRCVANPIPFRRFFLTVLVYFSAISGHVGISAQETEVTSSPVVPVKLSEMPERFFQVQDKLGYFWQSFGNGALVSGDTQYLQSGLNLIVDGLPMKPSEAQVREPAIGADRIDLQFVERRADGTISRDIWFDTERAGVRVVDTISNSSKIEKTVSVSLRTTFPFSWQSLHGSGGGLLSSATGFQLEPGDFSLGVHFNPAEGRHDTFFILGSEKEAQRPELKVSTNSRELTFIYSLVLPPGESRSLVHWVMQRSLPDMSGDLEVFSPFFQRGKMIQPGIDAAVFPRIVNFSPSAFQPDPAASAQLKALIALNGLMDRFGSHRRGEDLLWMSPTNQVSGVVGKEGSLTVSTPLTGDQEVKITEIAAIRGSAGSRQNSLIYLRNGRVLSGEVIKGQISWSGTGASGAASLPGEILDPNSLNLLLMATGPSDGVPPLKTSHFLQLSNGSVMALDGESVSGLHFNTPMGVRQFPISEVLEVAYALFPLPHYRLILKNGNSMIAFLAGGTLSFDSPSGEKIEIPPSLVDRIWTAGTQKLLSPSFNESWIDFSELPPGVGPREGFLLSGNTLIGGGFAEAVLVLSDGGIELKVETAKIRTMKRSDESGSGHLRVIELMSGDKIVGELSAKEVRISCDGGDWMVPADQLFAYRAEED